MSNSVQPSVIGTLLLDRTHSSKVTAKLLRDLGVSVEVHKRWYLPDAPDPEWIEDATKKGWIIVSGDKGIESDGINRYAVCVHKAKVFLLADTCSRGTEWAASLVMARHKILSIAANNNGPFFCDIDLGGDAHVKKPRFLEEGGPIDKPEVPITLINPGVGKPIEVPAAAAPTAVQHAIDFEDKK